MNFLNLLPQPKAIKRSSGYCIIPPSAFLVMDASLDREMVMLPLAERLKNAFTKIGSLLEINLAPSDTMAFCVKCDPSLPSAKMVPRAYRLKINVKGIVLSYLDVEGLRNGVATLRQLLREFGKELPCVEINDAPAFAHRGLMLDVSRGRIPQLHTLIELVDHLADLKINEFQLYTEHTFAYSQYREVWDDWGAITPAEILVLDSYGRSLGIELVPNQNSFGHLRYWLEHEPMHSLAETPEPWPDQGGAFLRHPATLAPNNPGTLPFLRGLYDELLPHFSSKRFNVGCDETWDLGRSQSKALCERKGKGLVYVDFLKKIHSELKSRGKQMMFWGDIIFNHPELVELLPRDVVALNWGYEANHPFDKQAKIFKKSGIDFYVCPGTSTWMSLVGRHDNALKNLEAAGIVGRKYSAKGYLNTDWGDGGHLQPLAVSYFTYLAGADAAWTGMPLDEKLIVHVLNRDIFEDASGIAGDVAMKLGKAHQLLDYTAPNVTPLGAVIAAPPPALRELFCRDGLKYFARIPCKNVEKALDEIRRQTERLANVKVSDPIAKNLIRELDLAARKAAESCEFMLWQQDLSEGKIASARKRAKRGIKTLTKLKREFENAWLERNKSTAARHWPIFEWRISDYRSGKLPISREDAAIARPSTSAD